MQLEKVIEIAIAWSQETRLKTNFDTSKTR